MQLTELFDSLIEKTITEEEKKLTELLEKCLTLKSPMKFTDAMGTDEEIFALIEQMKSQEVELLKISNLVSELKYAEPKKSTTNVFI